MFCHSEGDHYLDWYVLLVFICLSRPNESDILDLKHVTVDTYHELYFIICILLYFFIECVLL